MINHGLDKNHKWDLKATQLILGKLSEKSGEDLWILFERQTIKKEWYAVSRGMNWVPDVKVRDKTADFFRSSATS